MKLEYLKEKKELVSTVLLIISVMSVLLILFKVTKFLVTTARAEETVKQAIEQSKPDTKNVTAQLDKLKKVADTLKNDNLFSPPPPRQNPVTAVMGVFGDEAWINGKWYKVGEKVADATIVAVEPTAVTIEWEGSKRVFNPIDGGASSGPGGPSRSRSGRPSSSPSGSGGRPGMVVTQGSPRPEGGGPGMPPEGFRDRMSNMSEADRDRFRREMEERRERYMRMSPQEQERFRSEMRERFGRGGPGGGRR